MLGFALTEAIALFIWLYNNLLYFISINTLLYYLDNFKRIKIFLNIFYYSF
jgi:hypothetical protein